MKVFLFICFSIVSMNSYSQQNDSLEVVKVCEKYIRAFYESKPDYLAEVLHPELIKRTIKSFPNGGSFIATSGKSQMLELSKIFNQRGNYNKSSKAEIEVQDLYKNIASVKLTAEAWIDYLQLTKIDGKWQIINVLWIMN